MGNGKKFTSDSPSLDEIMRLKTRNTAACEINLNAQLAADMSSLNRQIMIEDRKDQRENRSPVAPGLRKQLEALEAEALESTVRFVFQDLGRKRFEDLYKSFPPTDEQKEEGMAWNPDEFGPALMAASAIEPKMSLDEANEIYDNWASAEVGVLVTTALNANMGVNSIPLSGSGIDSPQSSEQNLTSLLNEASDIANG